MKLFIFFYGVSCVLSHAKFHGTYIGIGVGGSYLRGEMKKKPDNSGDEDSAKIKKGQVNNLSYCTGFYGGYLYNVENSQILTGGELSVIYPGNNFSKTHFKTSIQTRYSILANFLGGYIMNPRTAFLVKAGYDFSSMRLKTSSGEDTKTTPSFSSGFNMMYKVSENLLSTVGYTLSIGKKISKGEITYQPKQHKLFLGISYIF